MIIQNVLALSCIRNAPSILYRSLQGQTSTICARNFGTYKDDSQTLYEYRQYNIYPTKMKEFTDLTEKLYHLRTNHSKLIGHWTVEYGALNQLVHIWEYDSYAHRQSVRAKLAADPQWNTEYVSKAFPMIAEQRNVLLRPLPGYEITPPPHTNGIYGLKVFTIKNDFGKGLTGLLKLFEQWKAITDRKCHFIGAFLTEYGPGTDVLLLDHYPDADIYAKLHSVQLKLDVRSQVLPYLQNVYTKGLVPTKVSPLQ